MICSKALNYFLTSTYDLNQNSNSAPSKPSIRRHRVHLTKPLPKTQINSVSLMGSRSHRDGLANSLIAFCNNFGPTETYNRSHRVCVIGLTEITLCPNPNEIGPTELTCRSHRKSYRSHFELNRSDRVW